MRPSKGVGAANWLVSKTSGLLDSRLTRRSFVSRATLVGTAVAATGCSVVTRPGAPYTRIVDCPGGTLCRDGYTEFCCVINQGVNACPSNTIAAGWWRADYSVYCNGTRYYIDCNEVCCGPRRSDGFCASCEPVRCAAGCHTRKVYGNYFRYGQCNQFAAHIGPIACRMVTCVPPYHLDIGCSPSGAVDNATANHNADCAAYLPPPPPPPPPPPAVEVSLGAPVLDGAGSLFVFVRDGGGALSHAQFVGGSWQPWANQGGVLTSRVVAVSHAAGALTVAVRGTDNAYWFQQLDPGSGWSGWSSLAGALTSDPAIALDHSGQVWVIGRGIDNAYWFRRWAPASGWTGWSSLAGILTSDPAIALDHSGQVWVIGRGIDNAYWFRRWAPASGWTEWTSLAGGLTSDPALVVDQSGGLWVVGRGTDNAYWFRRSDPTSGFAGWQSIGGLMTSDPAAAVDQAGGVIVVGRGSDQAYWFRRWDSTSGWTAWVALPAMTMTSDPALVQHPAGGVAVFGRGTDNALWMSLWNGTTWSAWESRGGTIASVRGATSA